MFNLFKKKEKCLYAPVSGKCIDISEVNDETFSSKALGDGIAIEPVSNEIVAPANGKIEMIFPTGHAFGMNCDNGYEIIIHIGIDTVELNGNGFTVLKKVGSIVKKGEPIIRIDIDTIKKSCDPVTMMIVTNQKEFVKTSLSQMVTSSQIVIKESW